MDTALFDYPLPEALIAQRPAEPRDSARLLVVNRATRQVRHHIFRELPELLPARTRLFRNHASVFKARLNLTRPTGGELECLLLHPDLQQDPGGHLWWCLLRPGKKYPLGATFGTENIFTATVVEKSADGRVRARFEAKIAGGMMAVTERLGEMPLPPYIRRKGADAQNQAAPDAASYQTVYADPAKKSPRQRRPPACILLRPYSRRWRRAACRCTIWPCAWASARFGPSPQTGWRNMLFIGSGMKFRRRQERRWRRQVVRDWPWERRRCAQWKIILPS